MGNARGAGVKIAVPLALGRAVDGRPADGRGEVAGAVEVAPPGGAPPPQARRPGAAAEIDAALIMVAEELGAAFFIACGQPGRAEADAAKFADRQIVAAGEPPAADVVA